MVQKKNMKHGSKFSFYFVIFFLLHNFLLAADKITSTPLINLDKIKPSFEELNEENENSTDNQIIKKRENQKIP